jgi:mRNA interferase RelE/StbE
VPKKAQKEIDELENKERLRLLLVMTLLSSNPFVGKKLKGEYSGIYSYCVWPYRILYEIRKKEPFVLLVKIGHRQ